MVFDEVPQQSWVSTVCSYRVNHVVQVADVSTGRLESIEQLIVASLLVTYQGPRPLVTCLHWVIQNTVEIVLIRTCICWIPVKDFSDTVDTCSIIVVGPEGLLNMFHGVNT